jgi:hypothetical protein
MCLRLHVDIDNHHRLWSTRTRTRTRLAARPSQAQEIKDALRPLCAKMWLRQRLLMCRCGSHGGGGRTLRWGGVGCLVTVQRGEAPRASCQQCFSPLPPSPSPSPSLSPRLLRSGSAWAAWAMCPSACHHIPRISLCTPLPSRCRSVRFLLLLLPPVLVLHSVEIPHLYSELQSGPGWFAQHGRHWSCWSCWWYWYWW